MILQRSTLTAQPQGPVEVDWNNPLTRGLLTLAIPRGDTMYCVAQRRMYTATSVRPTVGTSLSGLGQRSVNSTIAFSHLPLTAFDLGDATIAVRQVCSTLVASARPAGFSRSSSVNPTFRIDQNPSAQARPRFGILNNSGTNLGTIISGAADPVRFSATQAFSMVTAADATEIRAISEGFVYTPVARIAGTPTLDRFSVGGQSSSTDRLGFDGFVFVAAAWTRALSTPEMAEVDRNIWQLFARPRGRSFVAFGAAAGGTSTSITPNGLSHSHTLSVPTVTASIGLTPAGLSHLHTLSAATIFTDRVLTPADLSHLHTLSEPALVTGLLLTPAGLSHLHTLSVPALTLAINLTPNGLSHLHTLSVPAVSSVTNLTPAGLSHLHTLSVPTVDSGLTLTPNGLSHLHTLSAPTLTLALNLTPDGLSHLHTLSTPALSLLVALTPNGLSHLHTLTSPGVTTVAASNLYQATAANKPTLSTVPGVKAAAAGFNSFLFDSTDSFSCDFDTSGTPVFYAWLDDGTEQTTYTSATGGTLTFNIPNGRKLLLAVAHPSTISAADLAKFRALADYIRTT